MQAFDIAPAVARIGWHGYSDAWNPWNRTDPVQWQRTGLVSGQLESVAAIRKPTVYLLELIQMFD
jgi:hypothetical protein